MKRFSRFTHVLNRSLVALVMLIVISEEGAGTWVDASELASPSQAHKNDMVILLHGLGRGTTSMWMLDYRLSQAGFDVHRIGYDSLTQSPDQIVEHVSKQIKACCQSSARKVHFVGHSLGGLIIRAYLEKERPQHLGRVVMLGTPNQGTAAVDYFRQFSGFNMLGSTTRSLGTDSKSFPLSLSEPNYPVGVIAGYTTLKLNEWYLKGIDDGLVTIEATKIPNMTDFITMNAGHAMLRYKSSVARQVVAFLKRGKFDREAKAVQ